MPPLPVMGVITGMMIIIMIGMPIMVVAADMACAQFGADGVLGADGVPCGTGLGLSP